jgi:NarL family two-component system response regulator LiaR
MPMDLLMRQLDGVSATQLIREKLADTEVIALTSVLADAQIVGAICAGAIGYLLKDTRADNLQQAIKSAAAGQVQPEATCSPRSAAA